MPRQRIGEHSPLKRPSDSLDSPEDDPESKKAKVTVGDLDEATVAVNETDVICYIEDEDGPAETNQDPTDAVETVRTVIHRPEGTDIAEDATEYQPRERSMSDSSTPEQRNRSLEALFKVTDNELQAIAKKDPEVEPEVVEIENDGNTESYYMVDGIQEREELVGESETEEDISGAQESEESDTGDADLGEAQAASENDVPTTPGSETKWRQFKNIERILQKAGIDTSSKTWLTLTRPGKHICPYCQRACSKPSVLEKHIRAHTGERPYPCSVCGFSFKTKSNLYKHCKSRAHMLKCNVELNKRKEGASSSDKDSNMPAVEIFPLTYAENEKKKEPVQKHVMQEVVKYLGKDKDQRPNEVQTERQRARLERLKSLQVKDDTEVKRRENIQRQLSLPVYPTSSPITNWHHPTGNEGEVRNIAKIMVPEGLTINEKGEIVQRTFASSSVTSGSQASHSQTVGENLTTITPNSLKRIQVVNLPEPSSDPENVNKALSSLEELSDRLAKEGTGFSTSVRSLPDKRVQIVLELSKPDESRQRETEAQLQSSQAFPNARNLSSLRERIQNLISRNEAIIDTPKLEPPRAKVVRSKFSRQESEPSISARSETESSVSNLLLTSAGSGSWESSTESFQTLPQRQKSVIVENIESTLANNNVFMLDESVNDQRQLSREPNKFSQSEMYIQGPDGKLIPLKQLHVSSPPPVGTFSSGPVSSCSKGVMASKTRPGFELPLTTTFLPLTSNPVLASHLNRTQPTQTSNSPALSSRSSSVTTLTSPARATLERPSLHSPGQIGRMALKNLQNRSKSLSSVQVPQSPLTPVVSSVVLSLPRTGQPQYILQTPVQTVTTPSLPVAQVLLPGSSVPMLIVGESPSSTTKVPMQQTFLLQSPQTPNLAARVPVTFTQTPVQTPTQAIQTSIPGQRLIIQQSPNTPTVVSAPVLAGTVFPSKNVMTPTGHIPGSSQMPDPMKILSSIVSNTVNQQKDGPGSKAKEIKIEIKLQTPVTTATAPIQTVTSPGFALKHRPKILKRQNSVSLAAPPLPSPATVTSSKTMFCFEGPVTTPTTLQQILISPVKSPMPGIQSSTQKPGQKIETSQNCQATELAVVKEYYTQSSFTEPGQANSGKKQTPALFVCPHCGISFKKEVTLDLHAQFYCKYKDQAKTNVSGDFKTLKSSGNQDINSNLAEQQSLALEVSSSKESVSSLPSMAVPVKDTEESKERIKSEILNITKSKTFDASMFGKGKDWQSRLRGQILKRKLKGKILMHRSLSVDPAVAKEVEEEFLGSKPSSKTKSVDVDFYKGPIPVKRPRLVRSLDDSYTNGIRVQRPVFKRSESVPSTSVSSDMDSFDETDDKMTKEKLEKTAVKEFISVTVPVMTANYVVSNMAQRKPIYQQNFHMKLFEGMGTPVQLVPSATRTPRPELMEMEKVRKMFTFDASTLKLVPKTELAEKLPSISKESIPKASDSQLEIEADGSTVSPINGPVLLSPEKFPSPTAKKSPFLRQFSLVSHSYPSMRSMTHLSFCTTDRLQPCYVKANKKISMYSNWRVASQNNNPLGLATRALLSLYNSRYSTNPVIVTNCGFTPRISIITHSSYWKDKAGSQKTGGDMVVPLDILKDSKKAKNKLQGGYKSSEAYVYIRGRGRGKYVCESCGIRCRKPSMLKKHIRTHTNLRPFKCKQCKFSFKTKGNLTKHMKSKSHIKKCINLGISPFPCTIDETQIDASALAAQCRISKQAKIVDEMERSLEENDTEMVDIDEMEEPEDEEDMGEEASDDDGDMQEGMEFQSSSTESVEEGQRTAEAEGVKILEESENERASTVTSTQTQHNQFLQTLGIIAKQQLDGSHMTPSMSGSLLLPGGTTLPAETITSLQKLGISLGQMEAEQKTDEVSSAAQNSTNSSLMTIYGNLAGTKEEGSKSKDSDVIWGLLNLSDQTQPMSGTGMTVSLDKLPGRGSMSRQSKETISMATEVASATQTVTTTCTVNSHTTLMSERLVPPFLSLGSALETTSKQVTAESGPIIGQILKNVDPIPSSSKGDTEQRSKSSTTFVPFHFQHPFPGTPTSALSTDILASPGQPVSSGQGQSSASLGPGVSTTPLVTKSVILTPHGLTSLSLPPKTLLEGQGQIQGQTFTILPAEMAGWPQTSVIKSVKLECPSKLLQTVRAEIVNIDPAVFNQEQSKLQRSVSTETDSGKAIANVAWKSDENGGRISAVGQVQTIVTSEIPVTSKDKESMGARNHGKNRFVCECCNARFPEYHQLILHGNIHLMESSRIRCEKCGQKFRSHSSYEKHMHEDHEREECTREVTSTNSKNPRPYQCQSCDIGFRSKSSLGKHIKSKVHFTNLEILGKVPAGSWEKVKDHVTEQDESSTESLQTLLDSDGQNRTKVIVETISQDTKVAVSGDSEMYYVEDNDNDNNGDGGDDQELGEDGNTEETMDQSESQKGKPHQCGLCRKGFESVSLLRTHLITHAELRPYVCEYCDAGFTNAQSLQTHLKSHTQEMPYICGMCGKKFSSSTQLKEHCKLSHPRPGMVSSGISMTTRNNQNIATADTGANSDMITEQDSVTATDTALTFHSNTQEGESDVEEAVRNIPAVTMTTESDNENDRTEEVVVVLDNEIQECVTDTCHAGTDDVTDVTFTSEGHTVSMETDDNDSEKQVLISAYAQGQHIGDSVFCTSQQTIAIPTPHTAAGSLHVPNESVDHSNVTIATSNEEHHSCRVNKLRHPSFNKVVEDSVEISSEDDEAGNS